MGLRLTHVRSTRRGTSRRRPAPFPALTLFSRIRMPSTRKVKYKGGVSVVVGVGKGAMPVDDDDEDDDEDEVPPPNDDNLLISSTQSVDPQDIDTSCRVRRTTRRGFVSARLSRHREVAMSALTLGPPRSPLLPRNSQGNALMPPHYAATVNKVTRIQRCI